MLHPHQLDLIAPDDSALERLHRDVRLMGVLMADIRDSLPLARRPLSESTRALHVHVVAKLRGGYCPCCQQVKICTSDGRLEGAEYDHWYARHRNGVEETWLVCGPCNRALENTEYKAIAQSSFLSYRAAVCVVVRSAQAELFS